MRHLGTSDSDPTQRPDERNPDGPDISPPGALPRVEASDYLYRPRCDFAVTEEALGVESRTR
jgi:hypothetical protein